MKTYQGSKESTVTGLANVCQKLAGQIELAKRRLWIELRGTFEVPEKMFRLALGEAEALAWQTEYPQLVFTDLAMEKVQAVAAWHGRQQSDGRRHTFPELAA
jgi:hypothetical protein